jgi:hypothetical protein
MHPHVSHEGGALSNMYSTDRLKSIHPNMTDVLQPEHQTLQGILIFFVGMMVVVHGYVPFL